MKIYFFKGFKGLEYLDRVGALFKQIKEVAYEST
jgi:hypothetical protein